MEEQEFQNAVVRLGHLSIDGVNNAFIEEYRMVMTKVYNEMMGLQHIDRIRSGFYHEQGATLMALLRTVMARQGIELPETPPMQEATTET